MFKSAAAAKCIPDNRRCAMPCDDASITAAFAPSSAKSRKILCSETASGVVFASGRIAFSDANPAPKVPTTPVRIPPCDNNCAAKNAVVVFPFVPVIAAANIRRLGFLYATFAISPARSANCGTGAFGACIFCGNENCSGSHKTPAAPDATASAI